MTETEIKEQIDQHFLALGEEREIPTTVGGEEFAQGIITLALGGTDLEQLCKSFVWFVNGFLMAHKDAKYLYWRRLPEIQRPTINKNYMVSARLLVI